MIPYDTRDRRIAFVGMSQSLTDPYYRVNKNCWFGVNARIPIECFGKISS